MNLLLQHQKSMSKQLLLKYLRKDLLELSDTIKKLCVEWKPSKLVIEAPRPRKISFAKQVLSAHAFVLFRYGRTFSM